MNWLAFRIGTACVLSAVRNGNIRVDLQQSNSPPKAIKIPSWCCLPNSELGPNYQHLSSIACF